MDDAKKLIIISSCILLIIIIVVIIIILNKTKKKQMRKKINNLDVIKNDVLSLPLLSEIEKVSSLTKGEQLEEKINNYKKVYEDLKTNSFKKIEDMILELDFLVQEKPKDFNYKYSLIELELYKNRYLINHILEELKELTSYEDKYRGLIIKLKNKYRIINREYESNKDLYGVLTDTIDMQFENIEKRFQDFEIVINENLYNEVVLVVRSLENMIDHMGAIILEVPDILVLLNDLIPSRIKELEVLRTSIQEEGFTLTFMNLDYNLAEIEKIENDIVDRSKVLNIDNSLIELKTILEFLDSLFKDIEKEKVYKKDFDASSYSFDQRLSNLKNTLRDIYKQLDDIKVMYGLNDEDLKDLETISLNYNDLVKEYKALIRKVKKQEFSYGKINVYLNELSGNLKLLEDNLDLTLKNLGSMQDDEERARDQLEEVQELLKICKRQIQSVKIPVVANNYFVELSEANEAILEIIKELAKKPIVIKTLNTRVDTARDLVFKLYNTTKNIIKNAYISENLIVYANRYRSSSSDVMKNLNKAEVMFYKGNYEGSLKLVLDLLDKLEPGFKTKINSI
ncbi:MAG: septation ring formation regulator EzrA [Erysipelotrichaceae bacterium]|nr:septation ring formation regulator EzrA [Erysipelotrichaceae bacterium]